MQNEENGTSGKCLSVMLRRLLCTGNIPTHPSDNNFAESTHPNKTPVIESPIPPTPGIVARLMGLESFPDINIPRKRTTLDSIMRSRSVSSVDYFPQFDLTRLSQHRRVRTSVSFREVTTTLMTPRNNEFLVMCFDKFDGPTNKTGLNERKREVEKKGKNMRERIPVKRRESEERKKKTCTKRREEKKISAQPASKVESVLLHKKDVYRKPSIGLKKNKVKDVGLKCTNQTKNQNALKKGTSKFSSANSSPVPVSLISGRKGVISRKKLSTITDKFNYPSPDIGPNLKAGEKFSTKIDRFNYPSPDIGPNLKADDQEWIDTNNEGESEYCINVLVKVYRLTEEDAKMCIWPRLATEEFKFEEISLELGDAILELLLHEIVDECCGTSILLNNEL